jgi:hypothetical protein
MTSDPIQIPRQGSLSDLDNWRTGDLAGAILHLFDNFHTFAPTDTPADYNEASFVGYAPITPIGWSFPTINIAGKAETSSPPLTFNFTAGVGTALVYGWYLTDSTGTVLLAVCHFNSPVTLTPAQPALTRTVSLTATSEV